MTASRIALVAGAIVVIAGFIALRALVDDAGRPIGATWSATAPSPPARPIFVPIDAPAADAADTSRERQELLASVRRSGRGDEPWNAQAGDVFATIERLGAHVDATGCYVVGCAATLTFDSSADYQRFRAELDASASYRGWTGGRRLTAPEAAKDGRIMLALVLYRPD